ncbi:MAG: hypothetical protein ACI4VW_01210 [Acutalibacteraceae bacterium]
MDKKYGGIALCVVLISLVFTLVTAKFTDIDRKTETPDIAVTDEATLIAQEGSYSLKITTVFDAEPDPKESDAPEAERVVVVVYEYTNDDIAHGLAISNAHFKAYDADGKKLEQYPQNNLFETGEVGTSGTFTASVAFALNNDKNYLKIEFYNDISGEKADAVFEQNW